MTRHLVLLFIYAGYFSTAWLLAQDQVSSVSDTKMQKVKHIANELRNCPSWLSVSPSDVRTRKKITEIYVGLSVYDTATIREGVKELFKGTDDPLESDAKVFALLRILFQLPEHYVTVGKPFTSMGNPLHNDGSVDLLWPYSVDSSGHLALTGGNGESFFDGLLWDELSDFDHIASKFPRRPIKLAAERNEE